MEVRKIRQQVVNPLPLGKSLHREIKFISDMETVVIYISSIIMRLSPVHSLLTDAAAAHDLIGLLYGQLPKSPKIGKLQYQITHAAPTGLGRPSLGLMRYYDGALARSKTSARKQRKSNSFHGLWTATCLPSYLKSGAEQPTSETQNLKINQPSPPQTVLLAAIPHVHLLPIPPRILSQYKSSRKTRCQQQK
jgi:hypothetical protein